MSTKAIRKQLVAAIAMVMVAAIALGSSTFAWFTSNSSVSASMEKVQAASATSNLMIEECVTWNTKVTTGGSATASQSISTTAKLYPASLSSKDASVGNWYIVSDWDTNIKASGYEVPTITNPTAGIGAASYTLSNNETENAYVAAQYTLYTTSGTADVYLDNADQRAIQVTTTGSHTTDKNSLKALRVGIAVDGTIQLVYAPYAEAAANGNDAAYASADSTYKAVKSTSQAGDAPYVVLAGTDGAMATGTLTASDGNIYSAVKGTDGIYSAATGSQKLCTVGTAAANAAHIVTIYVWLEGTDTECTTELASGDAAVYSVSVYFAGVTAA